MSTTSGFIAWFAQYGQIVYVFVQMAFWVVIAITAIVAVRRFSQYVRHVTGQDRSAQDIVLQSMQGQFMAALQQTQRPAGSQGASSPGEPAAGTGDSATETAV